MRLALASDAKAACPVRALDALELDRPQHDRARRLVQASVVDGAVRKARDRPGLPAHVAPVRVRAFERLMRLQGVATPVPAEELRAYVPLLKSDDGGAAFLRIMRGFERRSLATPVRSGDVSCG